MRRHVRRWWWLSAFLWGMLAGAVLADLTRPRQVDPLLLPRPPAKVWM